MSPDSKREQMQVSWPDLHAQNAFAELPYEHARLNILEVESRVMERYLRSQREITAIRDKMHGFYTALSHYMEQSALATSMHLIELSDQRLAEEYRYYQDLELDLNRLIFQALKGLLKQDHIYELGQSFGKTNLLALYNLGLLADEVESDLAKAEYRLSLQFKERFFPDPRIERSCSHSLQPNPFIYFEPDYSASDFLWIDDHLAGEIHRLRLELVKQERVDDFAMLSRRRLGMIDYDPSANQAARNTIAEWLVPIASYDRSRRLMKADSDINHIYPHPVSTLNFLDPLAKTIWEEDLEALVEVWGNPERKDLKSLYAQPLSDRFIQLVRSLLSDELADHLNTLQNKGYIRSISKGQALSLWMAESELPMTLIEKIQSSESLGESLWLLGHSIALLATADEPQLALRLAAKDFQQFKSTAFFVLFLEHFPDLYDQAEDGIHVRDAYLLKLLNQVIYAAMLDEFQDFFYSQPYDAKAIGEYWLQLMGRWYPDLADKHEWLLAQEQSWRQLPSLIVAPYQSTVEFSSQLLGLQLWDLSRADFKSAKKAYTALIQSKRSSSLTEAIEAAGIKSASDIDTIKRLAYQLSFALDF